jgi:hypothetical protein
MIVTRVQQVSPEEMTHDARLEIFTAKKIQVTVFFWVMTPCSDVVGYLSP